MREDWVECTIDKLISKDGVFCDGDWVESKDQNPGGEVRLIQLADIGDGIFRNKSSRFLTKEKAIELKCTFLTKDDILLARMPDPLGRATLFPLNGEDKFVTVVDVAIIRPNSKYVHSKFLLYNINSPFIRKNIEALQSGTTRKRISRKNLSKILFPLPPLPEQRTIVSKIEQLFSKLDNGIANLKKAQEQLKIYRQAVLKKAFEGELTKEWREKQKDLINWQDIKLGDVSVVKRGKSKHRPRNDKKLFGGIYPFIQTGDVKAANGGFIRKYSQTYNDVGLAQSKLWEKGTLCLTIAANIADTAFLSFDACFPDSIVGIKTDENVLSINFLNYLIQKLKVEIDSKASATAQKNINVEFLDNLEFLLPSLEEQHQIVQEIECRLSVCDKVEETIKESLSKSEALRQSILKQAFEGRLLSEAEIEACKKEKDWEPAGVLLEKIKKEKKSGK